ncbi:MAG: MlaC/ttg2D family ABC transporter substrate-binding protein [Polyangiales bacterium]
MRMWFLGTLSSLLLAALGAVGQAHAAPAAGSATAFVRGKQAELTRLMKKGGAQEDKLQELIDALLDFEALAKRSLGKHWEAQSDKERARFVSLLRTLVHKNYQANIRRTLDYKVDYEDEAKTSDGVRVSSIAKSRRNKRAPAVTIAYTLHKAAAGWRVHDIITDGASLVRNYRRQFHKLIKKEGWDGLIARMEKKRDAK